MASEEEMAKVGEALKSVTTEVFGKEIELSPGTVDAFYALVKALGGVVEGGDEDDD